MASDFKHNPGHGTMFKNEERTGQQPVYRGGGCCVHCEKQVQLAVWVKKKDRDDGTEMKFLSVAIKPPYDGGENTDNDDIPL